MEATTRPICECGHRKDRHAAVHTDAFGHADRLGSCDVCNCARYRFDGEGSSTRELVKAALDETRELVRSLPDELFVLRKLNRAADQLADWHQTQ